MAPSAVRDKMVRCWCVALGALIAVTPTVGEVTSDGSRSFAVAEDVEQCAHGNELRPPSRVVTPGAINLKPRPRTGDLGCQVFDGTGVWTAPDGIECGEADGVCSSGVCVDKIRVASSVTFVATAEPTNMLIAPTVPQIGSNERVGLENELADMLIRLLRWAVEGVQPNITSTNGQLTNITATDLEITSIDATSMEATSPPVFYVAAEYYVTTGVVTSDAVEDSNRREIIMSAINAAMKRPRQATGLDFGLVLGAGSPFSAAFDDFEFEMLEGRAWMPERNSEGVERE